MPAVDDALLLTAVQRLADARGRAVDATHAGESLGDAAADAPLERLSRALARVGLSAQPLQITPKGLSRAVGETATSVFLTRDALVLVDVEEGRMCVLRLVADGAPEEHRVDAAGLARLLGVSGPTALCTGLCVTLETEEPPSDDHGDVSPRDALAFWLGPDRRDYLAVLVYAVAVGIFGLVTPLTAQALVSSVTFGTLLQPIFMLGIVLFGFLAATAGLRVLQAWVVEVIQRRLFVRAATLLHDRLLRLDRGAARGTAASRVVTRFLEIANAQKAILALLLDGLDAALTAVVGLTVLAFYHPLLLAFDVALLVALGLVVFALGRGGVVTSVDESAAKYAMVDWLHALSARTRALEHPGGRAFARTRADATLRAWLVARAHHFRVVQRQRIGALGMQVLASVGLLVVGGMLVVESRLTVGQLVAAEIIVTAVAGAAAKLAKHAESYYDLVTAAKKLSQLATLPVEPEGGEARGPARGPASLSVHGAPDRSGAPHGFAVAAGAAVQLVGDDISPAAHAVSYVDGAPKAGVTVELDGQPTALLDRTHICRRLAYLREPELFPVRLLDNVRFGLPEVTLREVGAMLTHVGADADLAVHGLSLGSLVDDARPIDPLLAVRIAVARVLLSKPGVVVLDGTLDALDIDEAGKIVAAMRSVESPPTLVVRSRRTRLIPGLAPLALEPSRPLAREEPS